jgi:drug/metabolite transporter (DMT)-like permease
MKRFAILGVLIFKDSLDRNTWIGVLLIIIAGIVASYSEGPSGIISGLLITTACICWAVDNHLTALTDGASPQTVTFIKGIVLLFMLPPPRTSEQHAVRYYFQRRLSGV